MLRKDSFNCLAFWDQILPHTEMAGLCKITEKNGDFQDTKTEKEFSKNQKWLIICLRKESVQSTGVQWQKKHVH